MKRDIKIAVILVERDYGELNVGMCLGLVVNIRAREDRDVSRPAALNCYLGGTDMMAAQPRN